MRFLLFDKNQKTWLTKAPINFKEARFPSHQWNAYNIDNNIIVADMITFDHIVYDDLYVEKLLNVSSFPKQQATRFTINLQVCGLY